MHHVDSSHALDGHELRDVRTYKQCPRNHFQCAAENGWPKLASNLNSANRKTLK